MQENDKIENNYGKATLEAQAIPKALTDDMETARREFPHEKAPSQVTGGVRDFNAEQDAARGVKPTSKSF